MKLGKYVLALDQGTTSSRAILFNAYGVEVACGQREFKQYYPKPGYVEHDPAEILESQLYALRVALSQAGITAEEVAAIGITNQRETTVAWDAQTGAPICPAIVWQCRRTAPECERLVREGYSELIYDATGLVVDAYFSGTKMKWILDHVPEARKLRENGRLRFGTVDTWLIYALTNGKSYVTDVSNAARTMLFNIHTLNWDERLLKMLAIPREALPQVVESSGVVGFCDESILGRAIPIAGIAGDQNAALFGQCCFEKGMAKNTYGTGCFVLMNTGEQAVRSQNGLLTTVGWKVGGKVTYALEGSAFNAGSAIKWLRDKLSLIKEPDEADRLAESVENAGGVCFVPAFTGLGAPYWDMYARGGFLGLTRGTERAHLVRAVLESIAYESEDLVRCMEKDAGVSLRELRVDGGASQSRFLMQFQADLLLREVRRPKCIETTALGAAMLAGLAVGVWEDEEELKKVWQIHSEFKPQADPQTMQRLTARWHRAVARCRNWETED